MQGKCGSKVQGKAWFGKANDQVMTWCGPLCKKWSFLDHEATWRLMGSSIDVNAINMSFRMTKHNG